MMKIVKHPDVEIHELDGYNDGQMAEPAHPILLRFVTAHTVMFNALGFVPVPSR